MNPQKRSEIDTLNHIDPADLVAMDEYVDDFPIRIDLAYARPDNALFGEQIYRKDARLWLYKGLAEIVLQASITIKETCGRDCILFDGLRPVEAQERMIATQRVQDHPEWLEEPRLLSPPGTGAHPRGMAIDITIDGLNMGTEFDDLSPTAHRDYLHPESVMQNRAMLTNAMKDAACILEIPLLPLPQEWWDFRFPPEITEDFIAISDKDLPKEMRVV